MAPATTREVEATFDVDEGFLLPDLSDLPDVGEVGPPAEHRLEATYFDTGDLRLLRHGITLRRRTGGSDAGWHLKLPKGTIGIGSERDEVRLPAGRATRTVPAALAERVSVHTRGEPMAPVVRIRTHRTERPVIGTDGKVLAEIAQDDVSAAAPSDDGSATSVMAWSELEVELIDGDAAVLSPIAERIVEAGARPSPAASKLARALADRLQQLEPGDGPARTAVARRGPPTQRPDDARRPGKIRRKGKGSASRLVLDHLAAHIQRLEDHDPLVRTDQPDAVHQMRVATRRLRSALATFRPLFDRTVTDPLRDELQWLGGVLGEARDAEVIRDHLRGLVEAEPPDLVLGPVQARIVTVLGTRYRKAHDTAVSELNGARYLALLESLDRLIGQPPLTERAVGSADAVLLPLVAKSWKRMRRLHHAAAELDRTLEPERHDAALHELRKAAKRARYAGEALAPVYGQRAKTWAQRMEAVQETLGAHHDSVVIRARLRELGVAAQLDGENGFTYGRLHALEQARADAMVHGYGHDWDRAIGRRLHRWLRS